MTPFWRFLPDAPVPDAGAIRAAAASGQGALARALREARLRLGAGGAARLLTAAAGESRFGRQATLLLAAPFQPRALADSLHVAFAIAGLGLTLRSLDGFAALGAALAAPDADVFAGLDASLIALLDPEAEALPPVAALAGRLATRAGAPAFVVAAGGTDDAAAIDMPEGVAFARLALAGPATDARFALSFGAIPSAQAADRLADFCAAQVAARRGASPKLVVTDLDGTLWRETLGESGSAGLTLHRRTAETLAACRDRGLVLAIASRNDPADVEAAFAAHPDWPLRFGDFAATAIGWESKDALVAAVLRQLDLAPAHALFVDDDAANCARVAARFPEADVRLIGPDLDGFAAALAADPLLAVSSGGRERTAQYRRRAEVEALRARAPDVGDFLRRLATRVTVAPLKAADVSRAAELAVRVNQFTLAEHRPGAQILAARRDALDVILRMDDAFGAHGLVGLVLARPEGEALAVENLYLSCRALGRGVEAALVAALGEVARRHGLSRVCGPIEITQRNEPARWRFSRYASGAGHWTLSTDAACTELPEAVTLLWETTT